MKPNESASRRLLGLLRGHRTLAAAVVVLALLASAIEGLGVGMLIPLLDGWQGTDQAAVQKLPLLRDMHDRFHGLSQIQRVRLVAVALLAIISLQTLLRYLSKLVAIRLQVRVDRTLKHEALRQLYQVSLPFINSQSAGILMTTILMHTRYAATMVMTIANAAVNLSILAVYAVLMFVISWQLTLTAVALLVLFAVVSRLMTTSRLREEGRAVVVCQQELRKLLIESISLMKLTHLHALEQRSIERCEQLVDQYLRHFYESKKLIHRTVPVFNISAAIGLSVLLFAGTILLPGQTESWLARTILFVVIVVRLLAPATTINRLQAEVLVGFPAWEAVLAFLDRRDKPYLENGNTAFVELEQGIRLENVTFRYATQEAPVLNDVTFSIPKGKMTAIVGASGSGKSTVVNLVARLYDCERGRIFVDDRDLREYDIATWRDHIAVVSQENLLYHDTLMENIRFAKDAATDEAVYRASRLAKLDAVARALPDGYDTIICDHGVRLSGGQQQRVAIARALVADPQLLILDEATSALDSETERAIQSAIETFCAGRTLLVAAHRLSTIRHADKIIVLEDAKVVQEGTHEQLMKSDGLYRQLVDTQTLTHKSQTHHETDISPPLRL